MPTYGYKCTKCENTFEAVQKINDAPIAVCPKCGGKTTRIFYPVGIIFKGSGFHITDYCRPKESKEEKGKAAEAKKKEPKTKEEAPTTSKDEKSEKAS